MTAVVSDSIDGRQEHDLLGVSVLRALQREFKDRFSLGWFRTFAGAVITFGVLPFFSLSRRFRDYISFERQQMVHLSDWLRKHHDSRETEALQDLTRRLRFREGFHLVGLVIVLAVVGMLVLGAQPVWPRNLLAVTYWARPWSRTWHYDSTLFIWWNVGLGVAYLMHFFQVSTYIAGFRRCVEQFNTVGARLDIAPVSVPDLGLGTNVVWFACALLMAWGGALWVVPLTFAGLLQRRYATRSAIKTRGEMADRMRLLLLRRRENPERWNGSEGPDYRVHLAKCSQPLCQAPVPMGATFCPRCGAPADPAVHSA
jgi:hypothetical protein